MSGSLSGKKIWVTGASSGIGEALAHELVQRGALVLASARRLDRLEQLKKDARGPGSIEILPLDVSRTGEATSFVEQAEKAIGAIDVMVHNAGISQRSLVSDTTLDVDRRIMEVNYFGVVALTKALLPRFVDRRRGHFVVVSSVTGYVGTPERSAYAASKHALHGFFESLRAEQHAQGLRVTMVCPGYVDTDITMSALNGDGSAHRVREATNAGGISPDACARAIARGIEGQKREVYVGGKEVAGIYLRRYAPGLLATALRSIKTT
jgi:dehydrogenase/reductase SDR family member 7B